MYVLLYGIWNIASRLCIVACNELSEHKFNEEGCVLRIFEFVKLTVVVAIDKLSRKCSKTPST